MTLSTAWFWLLFFTAWQCTHSKQGQLVLVVASVLKVLPCVAGRRKGGRKAKMTAAKRRYGWRPLPRSSRASRARLSPFPPLRTHATRATQVSSSNICKEGLFPTSSFRQMTFSISFLKLLQRPTQGQKSSPYKTWFISMYNQLQRQLAFQHKSSTSCSLFRRRYLIRHLTLLKTCCVTTLTAARETNIQNVTIKSRNKIFGFLLRQSSEQP